MHEKKSQPFDEPDPRWLEKAEMEEWLDIHRNVVETPELQRVPGIQWPYRRECKLLHPDDAVHYFRGSDPQLGVQVACSVERQPDAVWPWVVHPTLILADIATWAWERAVGPLPAGATVRRTCKDPLCCTPAHMLVVHQGGRAAAEGKTPAPGDPELPGAA